MASPKMDAKLFATGSEATKNSGALLREHLANRNDEELSEFLNGYARGSIAGSIVASMVADEREAFLRVLKIQYPEAFAVLLMEEQAARMP